MLCNCICCFSCFSFFSTVFFDGLQRLFAWFFSISALGAYHHYRPYQYDMLCVFKSCTSEIKRNSGFRREHVESCSLTTKNIIPPLTLTLILTVYMATKLGRIVTYIEGLLLMEILVTWSCEITWPTRTIISPLPQC